MWDICVVLSMTYGMTYTPLSHTPSPPPSLSFPPLLSSYTLSSQCSPFLYVYVGLGSYWTTVHTPIGAIIRGIPH